MGMVPYFFPGLCGFPELPVSPPAAAGGKEVMRGHLALLHHLLFRYYGKTTKPCTFFLLP